MFKALLYKASYDLHKNGHLNDYSKICNSRRDFLIDLKFSAKLEVVKKMGTWKKSLKVGFSR